MRPDILKLVADSGRESKTSFGTSFPIIAGKGDTFVRVDSLPNKVYKFDGSRWIVVNKEQSTSYLYDQEYIKYLVEKIDKGEYDIELLSETEKQQIEEYLTKNT
jgi:homospermidine synthase